MSSSTSVWDMTLTDFRDAIESRSTPGCGAAAAASAGFGLALVLKGLRISESKQQIDERAVLIDRADALLKVLRDDADDDVQAFDAYLAALQCPKGNEQEIAQRQQAIEEAAQWANRIPLATAASCLEALELAIAAFPLTASGLRSDAIAGGRLLHAGLSAVLLSVDANLSSLNDAQEQERAAHLRGTLQRDADREMRWLDRQAGSL